MIQLFINGFIIYVIHAASQLWAKWRSRCKNRTLHHCNAGVMVRFHGDIDDENDVVQQQQRQIQITLSICSMSPLVFFGGVFALLVYADRAHRSVDQKARSHSYWTLIGEFYLFSFARVARPYSWSLPVPLRFNFPQGLHLPDVIAYLISLDFEWGATNWYQSAQTCVGLNIALGGCKVAVSGVASLLSRAGLIDRLQAVNTLQRDRASFRSRTNTVRVSVLPQPPLFSSGSDSDSNSGSGCEF